MKIGHTSANFSNEGNVPSSRNLLMRISRGLTNRSENCFNKLLGMLDGPHNFDELRFLIISLISIPVTGRKNKEFAGLFLRKLRKCVSVGGIFSSTVFPMFVKKELKPVAISLSLSNTFF